MKLARREAREAYAEIERMRNVAALEAFRAEIGAVVRSASPVLISLLAIDGLTVDDAVARLVPVALWPRRPRLSGHLSKGPAHGQLARYYRTASWMTQLSDPPFHSRRFDRPGGDYLTMQVLDHSLELKARISPVSLESRFGVLRIQLDEPLPATLAIACVGRPIDEIIDHEAWHGKRWVISKMEEPATPCSGQTLIVKTGSIPHRITWPQGACAAAAGR